MTRHDERLQLKVVKQYLEGSAGLRAVAKANSVGWALARQWVAEYRLHGEAGLRRKGHTEYSVEFKLKVLERMQRETRSATEMRSILGIRDPGAIARWKR